jgi:hypothetical protein
LLQCGFVVRRTQKSGKGENLMVGCGCAWKKRLWHLELVTVGMKIGAVP